MLDCARYETPAVAHRQLGLLCTGYGSFARKLSTCPPRRFHYYAAIWISSGSGWLETGATPRRLPIAGGNIFWLFPGVTHAYAPNAEGWTEQWVLFEGHMAEHFERLGFLSASQPVSHITDTRTIDALFAQIRSDFERGGPLTSVMSAGLVHRLVLLAHHEATEIQAVTDPIGRQIHSSKQLLEQHAFEACDLEELARSCHMGYSTFRRHFKEITGYSPKEYVLRIRLHRAKELLAFTEQSITEVARNVGFPNPYYFSRLFHSKEGISPSDFRIQQHWVAP